MSFTSCHLWPIYPYGFGWFLNETRGHRVIEHSGGWQGCATHIACYPDDKLTIVVLTNLNVADPAAIAHGLAELFVLELQQRAIELAPALFNAYAGQDELAPGLVITTSRAQGKPML